MSAPASGTLREDLTLLVRPAESHPAHVAAYVWLAAAAAVALGIWLAVRLRSRAAAAWMGEKAGVIALRELAEWEGLADPAKFRSAVASVSGTVRRYVGLRFGIRAPTLTTEEFFEELRAKRGIPAEYDPFWERFMSECDVVKYRGRTPHSDQFHALLNAARDFVRATEEPRR